MSTSLQILESLGESLEDRGLYIMRQLLNTHDIVRWAKSQGLDRLVELSEMHVTILYSEITPTPGAVYPIKIEPLIVRASENRKLELFGPENDVLVLRFHDDALISRNRKLILGGGHSKWGKYKPHVTLCLEYDGSIDDLEPYTGPLVFGPEVPNTIKSDAMTSINSVKV
jgi:hypothetical protein